MERHCHAAAYAVVVLEGGYLEAGDEGRRTLAPGDVLMHRAFESHLDCFSTRGARVLILPVVAAAETPLFGRAADADALVRMARHSPQDAVQALVAGLHASEQRHRDWPDLLAEGLRSEPELCLRHWAATHGLRPETVSRGFQLAYGSSPKAFRATARARSALWRIRDSGQPLAEIAAALGYADQAHMSRAVSALTGRMPRAWRETGALLRSGTSTGFKTVRNAAV